MANNRTSHGKKIIETLTKVIRSTLKPAQEKPLDLSDNKKPKKETKQSQRSDGDRQKEAEKARQEAEAIARQEAEKRLREDRKQRVMKKQRLDSNIQLALGGSTGILSAWERVKTGIMTGSVSMFQTYAPVFVEKVEELNQFSAQYDAITSISSDPKEDLLTIALDSPLQNEDLIKIVNERAKKLKESGFLEESDIDPERLLEWYQDTID